MNKYLGETNLLNYNNQEIQKLISKNKWKGLNEENKIKKVYLFVRDEIKFGYNEKDNILASKVLEEGYGQCNTKSTLLMALLRSVGIPCRFHGFTINKDLQKGAISGIWFKLAPKNIIHSWVEVKYKNKWYDLEGVIIDKIYLNKLQNRFKYCKKSFCGFGIYTENLQNPKVDWNGNDTYIQKLGINRDFGIYDNPDEFYKNHKQNLTLIKRIIFSAIIRRVINKNVERIREGQIN
jgi:hypothetical protein